MCPLKLHLVFLKLSSYHHELVFLGIVYHFLTPLEALDALFDMRLVLFEGNHFAEVNLQKVANFLIQGDTLDVDSFVREVNLPFF